MAEGADGQGGRVEGELEAVPRRGNAAVGAGHRGEVVRGFAEVTRDDEILHLRENESVYLPIGCVHRLANPGRIPVEIVEVQTGAYLEEDDIVRMEDDYGRA